MAGAHRRIKPFTFLALALMASGCVMGTRSIELVLPDPLPGTRSVGSVRFAEILDNRVFEQKPAQASTPSVRGPLDEMTAEQRARLIGRQRNGYGKAMGDVALANDSTVQDEVRRLLEAGFAARGYAVSESDNADITVSARIDRFWGWFRPGFLKVGFESDVECDITINSGERQENATVAGHGLNNGQVASDANWTISFQEAYADFLRNLQSALTEVGL